MPKPHDTLVKLVLKRPENAVGLLRSVLPMAFVDRCDWATLRVEDGSFVPEVARELYTDILFAVDLRGQVPRPGYVYVVMEHQSTVDRRMPLRMLEYVVAAYSRATPTDGPLPVIVPLVVSHAEGGWSAPRSLHELMQMDSELERAVGRYVPNFELLIDDLAQVDEVELGARALSEMTLLLLSLLKTVRNSAQLDRDLMRWSAAFARICRAPNDRMVVIEMMRYILLVGEIDAAQVVELAGRVDPDVQEAVMTAAERLRQEGRQEGEAMLLLRLLRRKFGDIPPRVEQHLKACSTLELERYGELVLTAETLDEVLQ